jgi:hypothetical protein
MRKKLLLPEQKPMTDLSVERAAGWADVLVRREHRGPGDTIDAARLRAARKHRLPERLLWSLRYRKPKRIWADLYLSLEAAVAAEVKSQEARLAHELEISRALPLSPAGLDLVDEAAALLREAEGATEEQAREDDDQSRNWR